MNFASYPQIPDPGPMRGQTGGMDHPCPRCAGPLTQDHYGPCESCRLELRTMYAGRAREVETEAYDPKMNVTPNAVALKD